MIAEGVETEGQVEFPRARPVSGIGRLTNRDVTIGAVYAALDRLEDKALVVSSEIAGPAERGGRRRRAFTVTPEGRRILRQMRSVRERLRRAALARHR